MFDPKLKEALGRVQKPGRYTGGEPGSVYKDKEKVDVRFAFCFPDTYEVGMSFLGEKKEADADPLGSTDMFSAGTPKKDAAAPVDDPLSLF